MTRSITITLPFPPSVNGYWRSIVVKGRVRTLISQRGRKYRLDAIVAALLAQVGETFTGRLSVAMELHPPCLRKRDVDNFCKGPLDALTHAGVWVDDSQIDSLKITKCPKDAANPRVEITIREVEA